MGVLSRDATAAAGASSDTVDAAADTAADALFAVGHEPVMFCVHDAKLGEVAILHGTDEVVVKDPQLVRRVLRAASRQQL